MAVAGPKVAIVHDWLYGGGAELVVEQLHQLYPEAPIYTSYCSSEWRQRLDGKVSTGWLQHLGSIRKFIPFLRIWWFSRLKLSDYDLVISSSGAEAKGIKVPNNTLHVNYCHAPTHYYWSRYEQYRAHPGFGILDPLARFGLRLLIAPLRRWDYKAAQRPDYIIANSTHIQAEIKKYYNRDSTVIFPPVNLERFTKTENQQLIRRGFILVGRQTPYKCFDLAIAACTQLGLELKVIGDGPEHQRIVSLAGSTVRFLGQVPDTVIERELASAEALIFPGLDDFGIVALEAMAAGTPIIAYRGGGALDYIVPGKTGSFFNEPSVSSLIACLQAFRPTDYNRAALQAKAAEFSAERFRTMFETFLAKLL